MMLRKHSVRDSDIVYYVPLVGESLVQLRNMTDENQLFGGLKIPRFEL